VKSKATPRDDLANHEPDFRGRGVTRIARVLESLIANDDRRRTPAQRLSALVCAARQATGFDAGERDLATYTFNKHVIKHHFCPRCGGAPFGFGTDPSGTATAAINVRCLEGVEPASLKVVQVDGRST